MRPVLGACPSTLLAERTETLKLICTLVAYVEANVARVVQGETQGGLVDPKAGY